jgi:hypothetical protein
MAILDDWYGRLKVDRIVLFTTGQPGSGPAGKFQLLDFVKPETRVQKHGCAHDGDDHTQASAHYEPGRKGGEAHQEFREVCTLLTIGCHLKLLSFWFSFIHRMLDCPMGTSAFLPVFDPARLWVVFRLKARPQPSGFPAWKLICSRRLESFAVTTKMIIPPAVQLLFLPT